MFKINNYRGNFLRVNILQNLDFGGESSAFLVLVALFGKDEVFRAFEILRKGSVHEIQALPDLGFSYFQITSEKPRKESRNVNKIFLGNISCSCDEFLQELIKGNCEYICVHAIAVLLAQKLESLRIVTLKDTPECANLLERALSGCEKEENVISSYISCIGA